MSREIGSPGVRSKKCLNSPSGLIALTSALTSGEKLKTGCNASKRYVALGRP